MRVRYVASSEWRVSCFPGHGNADVCVVQIVIRVDVGGAVDLNDGQADEVIALLLGHLTENFRVSLL
jgi:hypothetical protein